MAAVESRDDVQPVANQTLHRTLTGLVTGLPFIGLGVAGWQLWNSWLHWYDLVAFLVVYIPTGLGVTVGFHRLFTHRSFKTGPVTRGVLAALGSAAIEGPIVSWVADHRKHHAFSDEEGDPHSPHVDHGGLRGLFHAHVGWLFVHDQRALKTRYAPDLLADPVVSFVNRTFVVWVLAGFVLPFGIGFALGGTLVGGVTSLLWGGLIRMFVLHHVTYSINSLCHVFGRRDFETGDESRNLAWLALPSFGESWHNNHHAFPTSSVHGLKWWQIDTSSMVIRVLERLGLAWDVVRFSPAGARI
jgi:stearoyl-CoA desaturase (delta-9 desaturase)